jgi:Bacterial PH domain
MEDPPEDIKRILGPNEKIELYIKEKIYHPQFSIDSLVITNERIILRHPHALRMKRDYTDYSYSDIAGVTMDKGMMRSTLKVMLKRGEQSMDLDKLPTDLAEQAYGIIRENIGRFQAPFSTGNASAVVAAPPTAVVQSPAPLLPVIQPLEPAAMVAVPDPPAGTETRLCPHCSTPLTGSEYCGACGKKVK